MTSTRRKKFYAICVGRGGPRICHSVAEFRAATLKYSGSSAKSFHTMREARQWLRARNVKMSKYRTRRFRGNVSRRSRHSVTSKNSRIGGVLTLAILKKLSEGDKPVAPIPETQNAPAPKVESDNVSEHEPAAPMEDVVPQPLPPDVVEIKLSKEQQEVLTKVTAGQNVFFTGPAGTGKSVVLREIIRSLRAQGQKVAITASTGIASLNIGGRTLHSFAGVGLGTASVQSLINKISGSKTLRMRWRSTSVLVVDEISMLDAVLFDKLEYIARVIRECNKAFGGIQLVLSGDFFQLPPVPQQSHNFWMGSTYAFDAKSWDRCVGTPVVLRQVFRQKDNDFVRILSSMRIGQLSSEQVSQLHSLSRPLTYTDGIEPSELFPLRAEVEKCNNTRLDELGGFIHTYKSMDSGGYDVHGSAILPRVALQLLERLVALQEISLKIGAQVMLIKNIIQGQLVNGSVGKVVEFLTTGEALERQIKIAEVSNMDDNDPQMAPSRRDQPDPTPLDNTVFGLKQRWPLVHFTNGLDLLCVPLPFTVEGYRGNIEAQRLQVPLILAWALSIHKSQGQTLERVKVDLKNSFEKGQVYVAISRATTMEALEICNFDPSKVMAHPRVISWQKTWIGDNDDCVDNAWAEMDCDEAIDRYHSQIDLSRTIKLEEEILHR